MTIRRILILAAVACLFSATNRSPAQGPPADTEQRLKALEEKMDRMLKLLDGRRPVPLPSSLDPAAVVDEGPYEDSGAIDG